MQKNKRAFTLIELLVVVLIIGILSAVALPQYQVAVDKARYSTMMPAVRALRDAQLLYKLANDSYATNIEDLGSPIPADCSINTDERTATCKDFYLTVSLYDTVYAQLKKKPNNVYQMRLNTTDHNCVAYKSDGERGRRLCASLGGKMTNSGVDGECSGTCTNYIL